MKLVQIVEVHFDHPNSGSGCIHFRYYPLTKMLAVYHVYNDANGLVSEEIWDTSTSPKFASFREAFKYFRRSPGARTWGFCQP